MKSQKPLLRRLATRRLLARGAILFEAVWPALWPVGAAVGIFLCAALLNLPSLLPSWLHLAVLAAVVAVVLSLLVRGLRSITLPDNRAADRRLEERSGFVHRPLSVLTDKPAATDALGLAVWQAHAARAIAQIGSLHIGPPRPGLARADRRAFRYGLLLCIVAALAVANLDAPARLYAAVVPTMPGMPLAPATELQAWITPPAYTRIAPIFLKADTGSVSVPAGSHLTVNVSGGSDTPILSLNDRTEPFNALDRTSFQAEWELNHGGLLTVRRDGAALAGWKLTVVEDQAPKVTWGDQPGAPGSSQRTRLPWDISDDYGVTTLQAELRLRDRPKAPPLVVPIPLPGGTPKAAHGISQPDLTANPWAGLPVVGRLIAHDSPGQAGVSADAIFDLGERPFHNPVAQVLIAVRKGLSLHPDDRSDAVGALDSLMQQPGLFNGDLGAFATLSVIYYDLVRNHAEAAVPEVQQMLWELALHMEEGQTEQSARALEEARQAARDAMDKAQQQPTDANRAEVEKRLEELRQAIDRHMQALMEEAKRNNDVMPFDPKAMKLSNQDMNKLAEKTEQALKEGRMADARQQMAELEKMLDQLRNARTKGDDNKQANSKRQKGKRQAGAVQDMIAREGGLLDHAQRRGNQSQGINPSDPAAERQADSRTQQALRRALGELMQQFSDMTGQVTPGLGEADQAMRDAQAQLNQGNDEDAREAQQEAIAALQKGGREMAQTMAKQKGSQPGEGDDGEDGDQEGSEGGMGMMMPDGQRGDGSGNGPLPGSANSADQGGRDPLGRYNQGTSSDSAEVTVPEERERQRTQAIQEELRRRGAEQERPRRELDYIDRLLKQF
jgi:uncharacterized protein (TIGR02302 family)